MLKHLAIIVFMSNSFGSVFRDLISALRLLISINMYNKIMVPLNGSATAEWVLPHSVN
jgi:hypothetical protein